MPAKLRLDMGVRFFLSGATECEIDKQGRFLIPSNLRNAANLEKEAIIIGVGTRLEIWNKQDWEKCDENISADEIASNMAILGRNKRRNLKTKNKRMSIY